MSDVVDLERQAALRRFWRQFPPGFVEWSACWPDRTSDLLLGLAGHVAGELEATPEFIAVASQEVMDAVESFEAITTAPIVGPMCFWPAEPVVQGDEIVGYAGRSS